MTPRRYVVPVRIRFDEAGADGRARASAYLRYLQDAAWQHSEAAGFDRAWYAERGLGWLVRALELRLTGAARYGERVSVETTVVGWRRVWARRHSTVTGPDGAPIGTADIDWVLLTAAGRPVRVPREVEAFGPELPGFEPLRVVPRPSPALTRTTSLVVRRSDVDPMGHLNNAAYLDVVDEALDEDGILDPPVTVRLEYLRPALPRMRLAVTTWRDGAETAARIAAEDGTELCRVTIVPGAQPGPDDAPTNRS
jgi:acyl-CoA thioesterase FadM